MSYTYDERTEISKDQFLQIIAKGVVVPICQAIVSAAHSIKDYKWLILQYTLLLEHPDVEVQGVTVSCIGHLSRLNESAKKDELLAILEPLLKREDIAGRVEDAMEDVNTFL